MVNIQKEYKLTYLKCIKLNNNNSIKFHVQYGIPVFNQL